MRLRFRAREPYLETLSDSSQTRFYCTKNPALCQYVPSHLLRHIGYRPHLELAGALELAADLRRRPDEDRREAVRLEVALRDTVHVWKGDGAEPGQVGLDVVVRQAVEGHRRKLAGQRFRRLKLDRELPGEIPLRLVVL